MLNSCLFFSTLKWQKRTRWSGPVSAGHLLAAAGQPGSQSEARLRRQKRMSASTAPVSSEQEESGAQNQTPGRSDTPDRTRTARRPHTTTAARVPRGVGAQPERRRCHFWKNRNSPTHRSQCKYSHLINRLLRLIGQYSKSIFDKIDLFRKIARLLLAYRDSECGCYGTTLGIYVR